MMTMRAKPLRTTAIWAALMAAFPLTAGALPIAPKVINGSATIVQSGNTLTVTNSNQAIINWQSFSIGANEVTRFVQPSANSSVLNRVISNDPSQLLGSLQSNGKVFLINPAGILVGQGARIDVAGFVASTLNLGDDDYLAGRLRFTQPAGAAGTIINQGEIKAGSGGSIYLVAPQVENHGVINAPNGEAILAAGQTIELIDTASPGVSVEIVGDGGRASNLGTISAEAGRVGIAGLLVENSGTLSANSLVSSGGRIFLKAQGTTTLSGDAKVTATGTTGGHIEILGDDVRLEGNTLVDASGKSGGGTVLIGGDYQGNNPGIQNASTTTTGANVVLKADAAEQGDGGKIVVWSDDTTTAYGNFSARGGSQGGDGGFVEVSGKQTLYYRAFTDTRAPLGSTGTLLLDPQSINIVAGAGTDDFSANATIYGDNITAGLAASNYIMQTSSGGTGNITFTAGSYNFAAAGTTNYLQLLAYGDGSSSLGNISIPTSTSIIMAAGAALKMVAGWDGASISNPTTMSYMSGYGQIQMAGGASISASGGTLSLRAAGLVDIQSTAAISADILKVNAGYDIQMTGNNQVNWVELTSAGDISYNTSNTGMTHLKANTSAGGDITIVGNAGSGKLGLNTLYAGAGSVSVTAQKNILDDNGTMVANIVANGITLTSLSGAPTSNELAISADVDGSGSVSASASGPYGGIRLHWMNGGAQPSTLSVTDNTTSAAQGHIYYSNAGTFTTGANTSLQSTNGSVQIGAQNVLNYGAASISVGPGQTLTLMSGGNVNINTNVSAPIVKLQAEDTLTMNGNVTSTSGEVLANADTLNMTGGSISGANGVEATAITINLASNSIVANNGDLMLDAEELTMSDASIIASNGAIDIIADQVSLTNSSIDASTDLLIEAVGDARINDGSSLTAGNLLSLTLLEDAATLHINDTLGMAASSLNAGNSIEITFPDRSSDGIVINGTSGMLNSGNSGFFVPSGVPAVFGSNLLITYGVSSNNLFSNQLISSVSSSTSTALQGLGDATITTLTPPPTGSDSLDGETDDEDTFGSDDSTTSNGSTQDAKKTASKLPMCTP